MKTVHLDTLCTQIIDCPHETPEWLHEGVFVVRNYNIVDGEVCERNASYVDETTFKKRIRRAMPESGDIVISREAPMGVVGMIPPGMRCCLGQRLVLLKVNQALCSADYLLFALQSDYVQSQIKQIDKTGSIVSNLNIPVLKELNIPYIDIEKQACSGAILKRISDKIALNKRINAELEAMAKTLYDYWFVQFDFPDENGKPYRTSGGAMEWNEQLKREIPKGWGVATINDMTISYRGVSYEKHDLISNPQDGVLVLRGNNIQNNHLSYDDNVAYVPASFIADDQHIKAHDIILTMSSGSKEHIGKCAMFQYDSPHTYGAFLSKFTPEKEKTFFVYQSMTSDYFKLKIKAICSGTGINNLTNQTFDELLFPLPDSKTVACFERIVAPIYKQIGHYDKESEELVLLRDWLLPMLMNGQATVE